MACQSTPSYSLGDNKINKTSNNNIDRKKNIMKNFAKNYFLNSNLQTR